MFPRMRILGVGSTLIWILLFGSVPGGSTNAQPAQVVPGAAPTQGKGAPNMANMNKANKSSKKAVHKHERNMHPGKPLTKLPNGNGNGKKK
jgi:hypothetical protein